MDKQPSKRVRTRKRTRKAEIHIDLLRTTLKYQIGKRQDMIEYTDSGSRNSPPFMIRLALEMNRCLQEAQVTEWMTKGKTTLIQKDLLKGTTTNNSRNITYLPMMRKILTVKKKGKRFITHRLFPKEQKWCCKGSRSRGYLLYIDQQILNESNTGQKNIWPWLKTKKLLIWFHKAG